MNMVPRYEEPTPLSEPQKFYVSLTWDDWPEGGSYGTLLMAIDYVEAEKLARLEMARLRAEEQGLCYHCGADNDDGEGSDGLCGDCADRSSDDEGEPDPLKELEATDAGALRIIDQYDESWHLVDCFTVKDFCDRALGEVPDET